MWWIRRYCLYGEGVQRTSISGFGPFHELLKSQTVKPQKTFLKNLPTPLADRISALKDIRNLRERSADRSISPQVILLVSVSPIVLPPTVV